jgi:hypothetical protein
MSKPMGLRELLPEYLDGLERRWREANTLADRPLEMPHVTTSSQSDKALGARKGANVP